uniref:Uncharacterized protein n=1 Tax=Cyprinus carpio TaxID=7962 RepID=A0A8C1UG88_CYPCA
QAYTLVHFNHYRQIQTLIHELVCDCVQKVDVTSRAVLDIMTKTTEYLQPNP